MKPHDGRSKPRQRSPLAHESARAHPRPARKRWAAVAVAGALLGPLAAHSQNVVGAMNELAPFCLGSLCLGMSLEEARQSMRQLEVIDRLQPDALCQGGQLRDVTAVANPRGEASVAAQFRRYAGAGSLEVQYRLWSISLTEAVAVSGVAGASGAPRRMSPADLDRLREGVTQRYHLRPTRDPGAAPRGPSVEGNLWLRALPQWQLGVTTQYNPTQGSSIILYALAEGEVAEWFQAQPGCGKNPPDGLLGPGQRPPARPAQPVPPAPKSPATPTPKAPPADWQRGLGA